MRRVILKSVLPCLLLCLSLGGCFEDEKKQKPRKFGQALEKTINTLVVPETKEKGLKPAPLSQKTMIDFEFPDESQVLNYTRIREIKALLKKQTLKILNQTGIQQTQAEKKKTLDAIKVDDTYQVYPPQTEADISTLPVDRTRILTTDTIIPAILQTNINSSIPGRALAFIPRDVN